ncbi:hypothetical protein DXG03_003434 [Asterophora parasitica]|uniref:Uncharacterized protein n=1 Tax=Asterophora parasitica TaxID=117018 RepID=A0A9P7FYV0_9AGAR|nr:hypothetical protein DXG03_003434 [Asterophora parasitica]
MPMVGMGLHAAQLEVKGERIERGKEEDSMEDTAVIEGSCTREAKENADNMANNDIDGIKEGNNDKEDQEGLLDKGRVD